MRPKPLVSPQWLHNNLDNPDIRVIENAWEQNAYTRAHIAGAVPVPCHPHLKHFDPQGNKTPHLLDEADFRKLCHALGMRRGRHYVIYDDWHGLFSARFWWVCRYYGFDNVSVLNGGWQSWLAKGRPVSCTIQNPREGTDIEPLAHPEILIGGDKLIRRLAEPDIQLWDTRRASEFDGSEKSDNLRQGHIPGACNLSWTDLLTEPARPGEARFFRSMDALETMVIRLGLDRERTIVPYCQNGIRAAFGLFVLHLLGFKQLRLYDGSLFEWADQEDTPLTTAS